MLALPASSAKEKHRETPATGCHTPGRCFGTVTARENPRSWFLGLSSRGCYLTHGTDAGRALPRQAGPERALVHTIEVVDHPDVIGLERQSIFGGRVVADLGPLGQAVAVRCAGADELAPVVDHLIGQHLLSGIERWRVTDVEQVLQFQ